jgi:hypothetical protein
MRKSLECCAQLVDVPNGPAINPAGTRHSSLLDEHPKLACRNADCGCSFDFAKAKYDWQKWQYVDSWGCALHAVAPAFVAQLACPQILANADPEMNPGEARIAESAVPACNLINELTTLGLIRGQKPPLLAVEPSGASR